MPSTAECEVGGGRFAAVVFSFAKPVEKDGREIFKATRG
jgi:hypothetical protein